MAYRLQPQKPIADELRRAAREQIQRALSAVENPEVDPDAAVHDVRKRCKKIRAVLRLARPALKDKAYSKANRFFRDTARLASSARDDAVVLQTFNTLIDAIEDPAESERLLPLRERIAAPPDAAREQRSDPREAAGRAAANLRHGLDLVEELPWRRCDVDGVFEALRDNYGRGRSAMREGLQSLQSEPLHEWRKRAKDHWYHVRLLQEAWKDPMRARRWELKRLTVAQGDFNDLAVLRGRVAALAEENGGAEAVWTMLALIDDVQVRLIDQVGPLGRRVYAEKPKRFAKRIGAWWSIASEPPRRPKTARRTKPGAEPAPAGA